MRKKEILYKNHDGHEEIIVARELTFAEYEEYEAILRKCDDTNYNKQIVNSMIRFAERPDGSRRFQGDFAQFNDSLSTEILATAYAFGYAMAELNTITKEHTDAMRKN